MNPTTDPKLNAMPGPAWRWISTKEGFLLGIPNEAKPLVAFTPITDPTEGEKKPPLPICDVEGCGGKRIYRLVSDFKKGACGMPHLKLLEGKP
jgi:Ino eighty subunit 2